MKRVPKDSSIYHSRATHEAFEAPAMTLALWLLASGETNLFRCRGCSICSSICPASGEHEMDPQAFVRLALMGRDDIVLNTPWIWSCAQCRQCLSACPEQIDIPRAVSAAKALQPETALPKALLEAMKKEASSGNCLGALPSWFFQQVRRAEATYKKGFGSNLTLPIDKKGAEVLLIVNFSLLSQEPELLSDYAAIFEAAGEDWTLSSLCIDSACPAWFAQDRCGQELWITRLNHVMDSLEANICIMDDCANPLAPFGAGSGKGIYDLPFEVMSMTELIFRYLEQGRISLISSQIEGKVAIQDPCGLNQAEQGRGAHEKRQRLMEFPRTLLEFMNADLKEMALSGRDSVCCGGPLASSCLMEQAQSFGKWRLDQIEKSGADKVLTICSSCYQQIKRLLANDPERRPDMEVLFLPRLVAQALSRETEGQEPDDRGA